MGLFDRHPDDAALDEHYDHLQVQNRLLTAEREKLELQAAVKQLERDYGPSWKHVLGVGSHFTLDDLRVFLRGARQGLENNARSGSRSPNSSLSPLPTRTPLPQGPSGISVLPPGNVKKA